MQGMARSLEAAPLHLWEAHPPLTTAQLPDAEGMNSDSAFPLPSASAPSALPPWVYSLPSTASRGPGRQVLHPPCRTTSNQSQRAATLGGSRCCAHLPARDSIWAPPRSLPPYLMPGFWPWALAWVWASTQSGARPALPLFQPQAETNGPRPATSVPRCCFRRWPCGMSAAHVFVFPFIME